MRDQIKAFQDAIDNALKASGQELTPRQLKAIQIAKTITLSCRFEKRYSQILIEDQLSECLGVK